MVKKSVRKVIGEYKKALKKEDFPNVKVYLFGSYARGDARPDSDIDVCLVSPVFKTDKRKYQLQAVMIAFHSDPRLEVVLADPGKFWRDKLSPLYSHIRKYAVVVQVDKRPRFR